MIEYLFGIVSATIQEQQGIVQALEQRKNYTVGGREYFTGTFEGVWVVCVLCGIGKVAAAITATALIEHFQIDNIVFIGTAGSGNNIVKVGDIVIGRTLVQHDMDCSPMYPMFEVPLTNTIYFETDPLLSFNLRMACVNFIYHDLCDIVDESTLFKYDMITEPNVYDGLIVTGDKFVNTTQHRDLIRLRLPLTMAIEMEGAAIAQVCQAYQIPLAVMRVISDNADDQANYDYPSFLNEIAGKYAVPILRRFIPNFFVDN
jgi:adenosylhomocysteine nucleosidase